MDYGQLKNTLSRESNMMNSPTPIIPTRILIIHIPILIPILIIHIHIVLLPVRR